jgi:rhodanese-related sulfurtransferase
MVRLALSLVASTLLSTLGCAQNAPDSMGWRAAEAMIARDFPDVPTVTTDALAGELDGPTAPLLLDAREPAEYAVSHLPGAQHVPPDADADALAALLAGVDRERPVVVYCSVGYRSARVAQRLRGAGFSDVRNLEGSIFRWANEGRPLARDSSAASTVHPFDAAWGRLLRADLRSDLN